VAGDHVSVIVCVVSPNSDCDSIVTVSDYYDQGYMPCNQCVSLRIIPMEFVRKGVFRAYGPGGVCHQCHGICVHTLNTHTHTHTSLWHTYKSCGTQTHNRRVFVILNSNLILPSDRDCTSGVQLGMAY
jgi:hypothetical protein